MRSFVTTCLIASIVRPATGEAQRRPIFVLPQPTKDSRVVAKVARQWQRVGAALATELAWHDAADAFRRAVALAPEWGPVTLDLATALVRSHADEKEARSALARARTTFPKNARVYLLTGIFHDDRGDWKRALGAYEAYLALRGNDVRIWMRVGSLRERKNDIRGARDAYRRASKADLDDAFARVQYALMSKKLGDSSEAIQALERAARLLPRSAIIHRHLAEIYAQHGQHQKAAAAAAKARDLLRPAPATAAKKPPPRKTRRRGPLPRRRGPLPRR